MSTLLGYRSTAGSRIHSDTLSPISSVYNKYICGTLSLPGHLTIR